MCGGDAGHALCHAQVVDAALPHADGMVDAANAHRLELFGLREVKVAHIGHDGKIRQLFVHGLYVAQVLVKVVVDGDHKRQAVGAVFVVVARVVEDGLQVHLVALIRAGRVDGGKRAELAVCRAGVSIHTYLAMHLGDAVCSSKMTLARCVAQYVVLGRKGFDIAQVDGVVMGQGIAA